MLNYSQRYCEKCKKWYIPKDLSECMRCSICNGEVHGDE